MTSQKDIATCAIFLFEGWNDFVGPPVWRVDAPDFDHIGGVIEQAEYLALWAERIAIWTDEYIEKHGEQDFPGVLAYEVWNPMGWWLAERCAEGIGATFTIRDANAALRVELGTFFARWQDYKTNLAVKE